MTRIPAPPFVSVLLAIVASTGAACTGAPATDPTDPTVPDTSDPTDPSTPAPTVFATVVRGDLFTDDLTEAQGAHDGIASYGQAAATAAGDFAHDAFTGTGLFGSTTASSFLAIDRWDDADAMATFYADPAFAAAFGTLFAAPPLAEAFALREDWYTWGDLDETDGTERFFVIARGRLADPDPVAARDAHDAVASAGEAAVNAVGDVGHVVFTGLADPQEFLAVDVWSSDAAIEAVYTDPAFAEAFGALFEGQATLQVYASTDWVQW